MKFPPGTSGNPAGRPYGTSRRKLSEAAPEIVDRLILLAKAGDLVAAKLILDRCLPTLKAEAARVDIGVLQGTLMQRAEALLAAATAGNISVDSAKDLIGAITLLVSIEQGTDLKARLDALEFGGMA
jgi:hypothetical protein